MNKSPAKRRRVMGGTVLERASASRIERKQDIIGSPWCGPLVAIKDNEKKKKKKYGDSLFNEVWEGWVKCQVLKDEQEKIKATSSFQKLFSCLVSKPWGFCCFAASFFNVS